MPVFGVLARGDNVSNDVWPQVVIAQVHYGQPVKVEIGFSALNVVADQLRKEVMLQTMHEHVAMSKSVLDDKEIPCSAEARRSLLVDLRLQPRLERITQFVLSADKRVTR